MASLSTLIHVLDVARQRRIFRVLSVLLVGWGLVVAVQGWGLRSVAVPAGIVCFEMPQTAARGQEILAVWRADGLLDKARWQIWLDYPFLVIYPLWFAAAIAVLLRRLPAAGWAVAGRILAWSMLLVMGLDAYENALMLHHLEQAMTDAAARTVTLVARTKFLILGVAGLWLLLTYGWSRRRR